MPRASGYCEVSDLLLGDLTLSSTIDPSKFVLDSADEIDARIGFRYDVPIDTASPTLDPTAVLVLKIANARLASGRLLMAQAAAAQDDNLHAYAMYLINEAESIIHSIANGDTLLSGAPTTEDSYAIVGPTIANPDAASAIDSFYESFMGAGAFSIAPPKPVWRPGE